MPHLTFHQGDVPLFVHVLRPGRTVIGRSDRCDVALPSESVSRVHCIVERRTEGWWLLDRSRHGTRVAGEEVERHLLASEDEIRIGVYTARFSLQGDESLRAPTAALPMVQPIHEEIVEASESHLATCRAELVFTSGPREGRTVLLTRPWTLLGGEGAHVALPGALPRDGARIRVVRGRAMVEPGDAAVHLDGTRVREITPVLEGEEIRLGEHAFYVRTRTIEETDREREAFGDLVGNTPAMRRLFGVLSRVATHDAAVLVTGESGTGKELTAKALHDGSTRYDGPFVAMNCAGIPDSLFESELFGHVEGAFTGAVREQDGAFQRAGGGTLFLDEVGELKPEAQAKLLRALESGEVRRVGGSQPEYPDVRVVAATNRDLARMVREGRFRSDLYFRLAVLTVRIPPLRERRDDIVLLARTLLDRHHPGTVLTEDAGRALAAYDWPGNVRELRNVLTRAVVLGGPVVAATSLSFHPGAFDAGIEEITPDIREESERQEILAALERHDGNRTQAARELGLPRSSLLYKMQRLAIDVAPGLVRKGRRRR